MYCPHCGNPNEEGYKFCAACGKSLPTLTTKPAPFTAASAPLSSTDISASITQDAGVVKPQRASWRRRLPAIGSFLVLVCFFMPWAFVSCAFTSTIGFPAAGYEIASGNYVTQPGINSLNLPTTDIGGTQQRQSDSLLVLFIIPILALIGLLSLNGKVSGSVAATITGLLGIGGMILVTIGAFILNNQFAKLGLRLQFREGFFGTWIGFLWQTIAAARAPNQK